MALDWWLKENSPAELVALVDLSSSKAWLFTYAEFIKNAQQHSNGKFHFYIYSDEDVKTLKKAKMKDFDDFIFEKQIKRIFGL